MSKFSAWKAALVDISVSDTVSEEVDLENNYTYATVLIPTITSSTVSLKVSMTSGGTYFPLYRLDDDATGSFVDATTAGTTSCAVIFKIGGFRYVEVLCGSAQQSADKTFYVRGFNP
jgi:hypothetical protein